MSYFSIIIAVYNQVGKMDACIASIRNQTFDDFEVILVNDGSTDDSASMLDALAKEDSRFRVLTHKENESLLAARLTGMKAAEGSHVLFVDSDDYIEPTTLEELHDTFEETGADLIRFGLWIEPQGGEMDLPTREWEPEDCDDLLMALFEGMPPAVWKNAYSGELISKASALLEPFYCNMAEDACFSTFFFSLSTNHVDLCRPFYHYIVGAGMSTSALDLQKMAQVLDSLKASGEHILSFVRQHRPECEQKAVAFVEGMYRHQLVQNIVFENDWMTIVRIISLFDREESQSVYHFACTEVLRAKMQYDGQEIPPEVWSRLERG